MNQCMGCQAGWPLEGRAVDDHRTGTYWVWWFHRVVRGYMDEIVACTRKRYL